MPIVRVHHPNLTEKERELRMEIIKQAIIIFFREAEKNKAKNG